MTKGFSYCFETNEIRLLGFFLNFNLGPGFLESLGSYPPNLLRSLLYFLHITFLRSLKYCRLELQTIKSMFHNFIKTKVAGKIQDSILFVTKKKSHSCELARAICTCTLDLSQVSGDFLFRPHNDVGFFYSPVLTVKYSLLRHFIYPVTCSTVTAIMF